MLTLVYLRRRREGRSDVLLGYKKRGFGAGKWNGFGGKLDPNDRSVYEGARREVREECGVAVPAEGGGDGGDGGHSASYRCGAMVQVGRNVYRYDTLPGRTLDVRVYEAWVIEASATADAPSPPYLVESDEMRPQWFPLPEVPIAMMWADDAHWLRQYLAHGDHARNM